MSEKYTSLSGNRDKTQSDSDSELEYGILIGFLPLLQDYFTSNYSGERLMIVLYILSGKSNRDALERSQHGPEGSQKPQTKEELSEEEDDTSRSLPEEPNDKAMENLSDVIASKKWCDYLVLLAERHGEKVVKRRGNGPNQQ
ncbi:hypothetical protein PPTG_22036 [Phytophthora nicotianae INRA-310]|uniref:Uncharacterized protein n=1 Tax=Phytophthora nicotianae (strain INRA-310) TaxID=761204 RepID=W2QRN8_PHYN3|nr:hypothetical protein PPTG_22036 [Phytophthora nicotianae INRA-310]ETN14920.1 hypothetical protein PPTG_22036 [Phytophthora nicotianae INRA-310]